MTHSEIQIEIQTYLEALMLTTDFSSVTEHTYSGVPMTTEPNITTDTWVRFTINITDTNTVEIGRKNAIGIRQGNLHINVYTPKEGGTIAGSDLASSFEKEMRKHETTNIMFLEPNTVFVPEDDWYNHHVTLPFYTTIGE